MEKINTFTVKVTQAQASQRDYGVSILGELQKPFGQGDYSLVQDFPFGCWLWCKRRDAV